MDTEKIREIVEIFENSQISRMDVEQDSFKIRLEKKEVITVSNAVVTEKKKEEPEKKTLNSPLVGTFYVAIKPGEKPLVQVGQRVKTGDVICIIEAMKSMNELKVNQEGEILEILVKDGQMMEYDQPLFVLGD